MEDALQPEAVQPIKANKNLLLGISGSVILHLAIAYVLLGLPPGTQAPSHSITYIDLNTAQHPAPMASPRQEPLQPKVAQEKQQPPAPENPQRLQQSQTALSQPAATQETRVEEQRSHTVMGLGLTKGYFKSLGEGETLRAGIKGYYLEMLQVINEKWWLDEQIDKRRVAPVVVNITIARNGEIINCAIMMGSGDRRYDKAVLEALAKANPLPPLPANYEGEVFQAPIRLVPPLNLMAW